MKKLLFILGLFSVVYGQNVSYPTFTDSAGTKRSRLLTNGNGWFNPGTGTILTRPNAVNSLAGDMRFDSDTSRLLLNVGSNRYVKLLTSLDASASGVTSVTATNATLTISPTTGAVLAGLNLGNANTWTATQSFSKILLPLSGGVSPSLYNPNSTAANYAVTYLYPNSGTDVTTQLFLIPKGTAINNNPGDAATLIIAGTDYVAGQTNYELFVLRATGAQYSLFTANGGTGAARPIVLYTQGNTNQLKLNTTGSLTLGTYGSGTYTGTVAKYLAVTSAGLLIEDAGTGGSSNTYTSTLTNTTNVSLATQTTASYIQVGNIVHAKIGGTVTITSANTASVITFTLPVTTATTSQVSVGTAAVYISGGTGSCVGYANVASGTTGTITFYPGVAASANFSIEIDYKTN